MPVQAAVAIQEEVGNKASALQAGKHHHDRWGPRDYMHRYFNGMTAYCKFK